MKLEDFPVSDIFREIILVVMYATIWQNKDFSPILFSLPD